MLNYGFKKIIEISNLFDYICSLVKPILELDIQFYF